MELPPSLDELGAAAEGVVAMVLFVIVVVEGIDGIGAISVTFCGGGEG